MPLMSVCKLYSDLYKLLRNRNELVLNEAVNSDNTQWLCFFLTSQACVPFIYFTIVHFLCFIKQTNLYGGKFDVCSINKKNFAIYVVTCFSGIRIKSGKFGISNKHF